MSDPKDVTSVDEYSFGDSDFVSVKTRDGWIYRFIRPEEHEPYTFDRKQRPDGTWSTRRSRTPEQVVEYMQERYDSANLQPDRYKSTNNESQHKL